MKFKAHAGGKERGTNLIKRFTLASTGAITAWKVHSTRTDGCLRTYTSFQFRVKRGERGKEEWQNRRVHPVSRNSRVLFSSPVSGCFRFFRPLASLARRDADLIAALIFMSLLLSRRLRNAENRARGKQGCAASRKLISRTSVPFAGGVSRVAKESESPPRFARD